MVAVVKPSAAELRRTVLGELAANSVLGGASITVDVEGGSVRLSGTVDCYAKRVAAHRAASAVFGVREVTNAIEVAPDRHPGIFDIHLARAVRHMLEWHYLAFARKGIEVGVVDGVVFLRGRVDTLFQRNELERSVALLPGVRAIRNSVEVVTPPIRHDALVEAISDAVARVLGDAGGQVQIAVAGRAVMLSGPVHSGPERTACLEAVSHLAGIASLDDHLYVD
jgi:osmotically-inducible protein OsmY